MARQDSRFASPGFSVAGGGWTAQRERPLNAKQMNPGRGPTSLVSVGLLIRLELMAVVGSPVDGGRNAPRAESGSPIPKSRRSFRGTVVINKQTP